MANPFGKGKMSLTERERMDNYEAEEARHKARMAGRHALAAKMRWEAVEKQWLATKAYTNQAARYENLTGPNVTTGSNVTTGTTSLTGILATQDGDGNGINGPQPPDRPLSVFSPDPDAVFDTYPAIRRGHWTHGGFPMDPSFGNRGDKYESNEHSGLYRSADRWTNHALYQPGTIISMMWHQDYAFDRTWRECDKPFLTLNRQSGVIYSKRRKFIVVARFQEHYVALPVWTSYANKLAGVCYEKQRVEFMQILHTGDSVEGADKFRLTPYDYLYQLEKRRQPATEGRQTVEGSWHRHMEDDWLDMKPDGEALLWLTYRLLSTTEQSVI
ncbi:hypothetical protein VC83_02750 [Pseudogymnoascus destructans]|uniref:DUF6590 domain-containing protein n=1 Tax=Pseudogymnoascus destructans TaxID=655981 RepID=A0A177AFP9_9PEZI|nr:uncharacterized protein VC83_02750 [Pseudogymnoascus destructans]OAF60949.2 hypothetical protein VC83_02750 [Pseudogymnoascus destructans]